MHHYTTIATVDKITRLGNSRNGNPRFALSTEHGEYLTQIDGSVNYDVCDAWLGKVFLLHLTRAGRVFAAVETH